MSLIITTINKIRHSSFRFTEKTLISNTQVGFSSSSSPALQIGNILLVASITKILSVSGTRGLDSLTIPLSDSLVHQILRKSNLDTSKKIDFFNWCSLTHKYKHSACTYSYILRTVCRAGFLEEVPNLLDSIRRHGIKVDSETLKFLLDSFIRSGKLDSALEILDYMEELETTLSLRLYESVLVALLKKNQVKLALSIFFKLLDTSTSNDEVDSSSNSNSTFPGSFMCNELLATLKKGDMKVDFKHVFDRLREKKGFQFDTWGYNICIHAFGCWGDFRSSLRIFKEMKESSLIPGFPGPDLCTYNSLIHVLCKIGKVKDALNVFEELKISGHEPDEFTYRILIQGCSKSYRIADATNIFNEMQYNGFRPNTIVYNSFLNGLLKARKLTEACQLFEKMVQDGVRASCWTYNILIAGLFRNGRSEAGFILFCDLKKKGHFVDAISYSIVILHLCKEDLLDEALVLVEEMEGRGFVVDLVTITTLLIELHKQSMWDWIEKLMKHVRDGDLVPSVVKWKANMEFYVKNPQSRSKDSTPLFKRNVDRIMELVDSEEISLDMGTDEISLDEADQWSSSPYMDRLASHENLPSHLFSLSTGKRVQEEGIGSFDNDMVNTFLSIFLSKGKLSLACKLFEIFNDMGVDSVSYTYNSIMSSFVKKGYFDEAWAVFSEMGEKICPADIATYNVIIQGLGKMGRADLATVVLKKLTKNGGYLDVVMYNTLINALGKDGRIDEANKLFDQMRTSGVNPDVVTFNTLIEVHTRAGKLKEAYKLLKMMLDSGCLPNHITDTTLDHLGKEIERLRYQKASIIRHNDDGS